MRIERITRSPEETEHLAGVSARCLRSGDVIALFGELGSGKTTFVRGLAVAIGVDPADVSSPTFVIVQRYEGSNTRWLIHVDAYRLAGPDELETIGWDELIATDNAIIAVEWADRIVDALPRSRTIQVYIEHESPEVRAFLFEVPDSIDDRFALLRPRTKPCRTCGKPVPIDGLKFPFCTERCRLIDLGEWFDEKHRISRPTEARDQEGF